MPSGTETFDDVTHTQDMEETMRGWDDAVWEAFEGAGTKKRKFDAERKKYGGMASQDRFTVTVEANYTSGTAGPGSGRCSKLTISYPLASGASAKVRFA